MKKRSYYKILFLLTFVVLFACGNGSDLEKRMGQIKKVGDTNPELALLMADSIKTEANQSDEHTRMTYELLLLRLNDKAYHVATSDIVSKQVVKYFDAHGNDKEKQEAYYYNGCVYRDLNDTPRALENFFKSAEIRENEATDDLILLQNTYSNLHALFYNVQDYKNSLIYAEKEYQLAKKAKKVGMLQILHVAMAYSGLDSISKSKIMFDQAYKYVLGHSVDNYDLITLILNLSKYKEANKAKVCVGILKKQIGYNKDLTYFLALGEYYLSVNNTDSAIVCYKKGLEINPNRDYVYDASKILFGIYDSLGNSTEALKYAKMYLSVSDSLDMGKRQELAASVNNQYQYHLDRNKQIQTEEKAAEYRTWVFILLILGIVAVSSTIIFIVIKRNRYLRNLILMSEELKAAKVEKEQAIADKKEQSKTFFRLLNKSKFEENAEDVVDEIKKAASGKKKLSPADWKRIYAAVDQLYPDFRNVLTKELGKYSEDKMQVCYLVRIGLTNSEIHSLTTTSRTSVYRWAKEANDVISSQDSSYLACR